VSEQFADFEGMLRAALAPVEPPDTLSMRLESTLETLTEAAAEELESWELSSMRDPRNWARPVAAAAVGTAAGAGLVFVRVRNQHKRQKRHVQGADLAEKTLRNAADEIRRLLDRG
jgi:hypothetical protein